MYNVILCSDINHSAPHYGKPAAIYRLASQLRDHGYSVKTVNFFSKMSHKEFQQLVDRYVTHDTKLFGISATVLRDGKQNNFFGIPDSELHHRLQYIKQLNPDIKFVLGGGQINNMAKERLHQFGQFDYVITGQGEVAIVKLAQHLFENTRLTTSTVDRPKIISDVTYPFNDFNQIKVKFTEHDAVLPGEALPLELARGCVFKCKFCSYDLTNKNFFEFTKTKDLLREELVYNYENFGTQYYNVVDDLINDSEEKVDMLLEVTESLPFKVFLTGYIRLDLIWRFPSMAEKLRKIGLVACFMGIETINDASGRAVGKGLGRKRIEQALDHCYQAWQGSVFIHAGMILGLPKDTKQTAKDLQIWGDQMLRDNRLHTIGVTPMSINPWLGKAEIDKNPENFGYKIIDFDANETNTRFIGQEANWTTAHYSFAQAKTDTEVCNSAFAVHSKLHDIDVFNMAFVYSLLNSRLRPGVQDMISKPVDVKKRNNLQTLVNQCFTQYQNQYIHKLLS